MPRRSASGPQAVDGVHHRCPPVVDTPSSRRFRSVVCGVAETAMMSSGFEVAGQNRAERVGEDLAVAVDGTGPTSTMRWAQGRTGHDGAPGDPTAALVRAWSTAASTVGTASAGWVNVAGVAVPGVNRVWHTPMPRW